MMFTVKILNASIFEDYSNNSYVRNMTDPSKPCVLETSCFGPRCPRDHEHWEKCPKGEQLTCDNHREPDMMSLYRSYGGHCLPSACRCDAGYMRRSSTEGSDECIPEEECPHKCNSQLNEIYVSCPKMPDLQCETIEFVYNEEEEQEEGMRCESHYHT